MRTLTILVSCVLITNCATRAHHVRRTLETEKWSLVGQSVDGENIRKEKWRLALERLRRKKVSAKIPPIVKLRPKAPQSFGADEFITVADSSDEWMHAYYRGLSWIAETDYDRAVQSFRSFLDAEGNHVYADRAFYWIVESYYRGREYGLCLLASDEFLAHFTQSVRRAEVLYRRALALKEMNQPDAAVLALRELMKQYAGTELSKRASKQVMDWAIGGAG